MPLAAFNMWPWRTFSSNAFQRKQGRSVAEQQVWDLWSPGAAAQGLAFARGRLDASDVVLVHAAPDHLDVDVWTDAGVLVARGKGLSRTADTPIARLSREGDQIRREDLWPGEADLGRPVIMPGGEVGLLLHWWNAADGSEWRWRVELYNHR
jgi:hypothetical protein